MASCAARRLPSASAERLGVGDGDRGTPVFARLPRKNVQPGLQ